MKIDEARKIALEAAKVVDSIVGYRADIDRCLVEIRHKNDVIKQLDNALEEARRERDEARAALRRVLPMAEAWFRREFDGLCDHEPGECQCDREAHARTDIDTALAALAALGKGKT